MARDSIRCSFCGKRQEQVGRIIAGPNVYICNECVELCSSILRDEMHNGVNTQQLELPDTLPTPEQIKTYMDRYIIGQDEAIEAVSAAVRRNRVGISPKHKPVSFIFVGSTVNDRIRIVHMREMLVEAVTAECKLDDLHSLIAGLLEKFLDFRNKDPEVLRDDLRVPDDHVDRIREFLSRSL